MKLNLILITVFALSLFFSGSQACAAQAQPTPDPEQVSVEPTVTFVPTPVTPENQNNSIDSITYIAEQAIETSNRVLELMTWAVGILITVILGTSGGILAYVRKTNIDALSKLNEQKRLYDLVVDEVNKQREQLDKIANNYLNLQRDYFQLQRQTLPFAIAATAYEAGKMSKEELDESRAWFSWQKWAYGDNETGYEELLYCKESQKGLPRSVIQSAITIYVELEQNIKLPGGARTKDIDKLMKLKKLLNWEN